MTNSANSADPLTQLTFRQLRKRTSDSAGGLGITVSYWADDSAAAGWKRVTEHVIAQARGRAVWYEDYQVRIATVSRSYGPNGPREN